MDLVRISHKFKILEGNAKICQAAGSRYEIFGKLFFLLCLVSMVKVPGKQSHPLKKWEILTKRCTFTDGTLVKR